VAVTCTFNALQINGTDGNGVKWHISEIPGWDGNNVRAEVLTAPGVAGGIAGEWVKDARHLSIKGVADAPSTSAALVALEALMSACDAAIAADVALVVNRGAGAQTMQVRLADQPLARLLTSTAFEFDVALIALNPVKT
jgi:hypothetical protein